MIFYTSKSTFTLSSFNFLNETVRVPSIWKWARGAPVNSCQPAPETPGTWEGTSLYACQIGCDSLPLKIWRNSGKLWRYVDTFRPDSPKNNNQIRKVEKQSFFWLYPSAQLETFHADPPLQTILAQNTAALVGIPARATGRGSRLQKIGTSRLKKCRLFRSKSDISGTTCFSQRDVIRSKI